MIDILEFGSGVLGYAINGTVEKTDIERVVADMDAKMPAADRLRLYVEINGLDGITPQALLRDLQLGIPRLNYLAHIKKLAVVTASAELRTFADVQGKLMRCETRVYEPEARETAISWLQEA